MQQATTTERMIRNGALASLSAGLVAGIGARIIMRIVALTAHMSPGFSIEGTLNILFFGTVFGFMAGFIITIITLALSASPKASKYVPGPIWRGLIWGLLLLLTGFPILINADAGDLVLGIPLLNKIMFGALFIIYGLTLGIAEKAFDHYLPRKPTTPRADVSAPISSKE